LTNRSQTSRKRRRLRWLPVAVAWLLLTGMTFWAAAALYFDLSFSRVPFLAPILYLVVIAAAAYTTKRRLRRMGICLAGFLIVLVFWISLQPSNHHEWQANLSQTPWAEIDGDRVTIHNFRNCYYRSAAELTCEWLTKTVLLSQLRGIDLFVDYWGSPWIAHPIVSFQFGDDDYVAASIEARYQIGQSYSPIRAFFRQFTIVYVLANERDLIRLRTNYRGCLPLPHGGHPGMVALALSPVSATGKSTARAAKMVQRGHRQLHDQHLCANGSDRSPTGGKLAICVVDFFEWASARDALPRRELRRQSAFPRTQETSAH
jgi:uncharacterized protein YjeT (DUF2065 family)